MIAVIRTANSGGRVIGFKDAAELQHEVLYWAAGSTAPIDVRAGRRCVEFMVDPTAAASKDAIMRHFGRRMFCAASVGDCREAFAALV